MAADGPSPPGPDRSPLQLVRHEAIGRQLPQQLVQTQGLGLVLAQQIEVACAPAIGRKLAGEALDGGGIRIIGLAHQVKRSLGSSGRSRLAVTDSDWPSSGAASGTDFPDSSRNKEEAGLFLVIQGNVFASLFESMGKDHPCLDVRHAGPVEQELGQQGTGRPVEPSLPPSRRSPAISRWAQLYFWVKRDRKAAAVMVPAGRPPMLAMSANGLSSCSRYRRTGQAPGAIAGLFGGVEQLVGQGLWFAKRPEVWWPRAMMQAPVRSPRRSRSQDRSGPHR